jgi:TetR/AcrR family transcriptional regulator, transcriptional repressor for nem operon
MPRTSDKRERLLQASRELIHRQGFERTTLADISRASGVPLGNVYYHFRSKEAILDAVADRQSDDFRARIAQFEREPEPRARLQAFLDSVVEGRRAFAEHGCPVGSLSQELAKLPSGARDKVNQALILRAQWVSEQFRLMGRRDAQELGISLIASVQGVILMANALKDPEVIRRQVVQLKAWLATF